MAEKHVHKLKRHTYKSGNVIYFCSLPDCSFKIAPPLALGKRAVCWRCGEPFLMTEYSIRLARPHCQNCHKPKVLPDGNEHLIIAPILVKADSVSELRARLSGATQVEDEGDI